MSLIQKSRLVGGRLRSKCGEELISSCVKGICEPRKKQHIPVGIVARDILKINLNSAVTAGSDCLKQSSDKPFLCRGVGKEACGEHIVELSVLSEC